MLQRLQKSMSEKDKGFTLIELLVVIVIIGILAGIAIPVFLNQRQKGAEASVESDLKNSATNMETYFVDNQTYAAKSPANPTGSLVTSDNNTIALKSSTATAYCIDGSSTGTSTKFFYDSASGKVAKGSCA